MNLSPLSGLRAADLLLGATADNTANVDTPDYRAERVDLATAADGGVAASVSRAPEPGVDLIEQMANLSIAGVVYTANARVLAATLDNEQTLLDVLG